MEKVKLGLTSLPEAIGTARPDDSPNPLRAKGISVAAVAHKPVIQEAPQPKTPTKTKEEGANALAALLGLDEKK